MNVLIKNKKQVKLLMLFLLLPLAILLYLMLLGDSSSSSELGDAGILNIDATTKDIPGVIVDGDTIFVFWQDEENLDIYYSYYSPDVGTWAQPSQLVGLHTAYGVDAVLITPEPGNPHAKQICLMLKGSGNEKGKPRYACTIDYLYTSGGTPTFTWSEVTDFPMAGENPPQDATNDIDTLPSVTLANDGSSFYMVRSQFWEFPACGSCQQERYVQNAHVISDANGTLSLTETGHRIAALFGPSITHASDDAYYTFSHNAKDENRITYGDLSMQPQESQNMIVLKDLNDHKLATKDRIATLYSEQRGHLYVAYKNINNEGIRFTKVSDSHWELNIGSSRWQHCELQEKPDNEDKRFIAQSLRAPTLFEYNGAVYLLYSESRNWEYSVDGSDEKNENVIAFKRIDNIESDSSTCTGKF